MLQRFTHRLIFPAAEHFLSSTVVFTDPVNAISVTWSLCSGIAGKGFDLRFAVTSNSFLHGHGSGIIGLIHANNQGECDFAACLNGEAIERYPSDAQRQA
ncbi:MAG: hypothetical protein WDN46_19165 [Methylocella sp.]